MGEAKRKKASQAARTWATGAVEVVANGGECFRWSGTRQEAIDIQKAYLAMVNLMPVSASSYAKRAAGYLMVYGMPRAGEPDLRPSNHGHRWEQADVDLYRMSLLWMTLREHVPNTGLKLEDVFVGKVIAVMFNGDKDQILADTAREVGGEVLDVKDVGHVDPGTPLPADQFQMTVAVLDEHHRLNPRDAVSISHGELFALAGKPLTADVPFASESIYLPRIPLDATEAEGMISMITVFTDATDPNSQVRTYAGYTDEELSGGKPYVLVR